MAKEKFETFKTTILTSVRLDTLTTVRLLLLRQSQRVWHSRVLPTSPRLTQLTRHRRKRQEESQ